jgi:dTDP-4-dehydrorhamnose 3,5-epimerase
VPRAEALSRVQSYEPSVALAGVELIDLDRRADLSGSLTELLRFDGRGGAQRLPGFTPLQLNHSRLAPGAIKAFHLHRRQSDVWFVPPEHRVLAVLVDLRQGSATAERVARFVLGDHRSRLLRIPPGVAHGCRNLGDEPATILYVTDRHFDPRPEHCDEGRLPWDLAGAEIWETPRD